MAKRRKASGSGKAKPTTSAYESVKKMKKSSKGIHFVICIRNRGYEISLERRKVYEVVRDPASEQHRLWRIIDESGRDNLYPAHYFLPIDLSKGTEKALVAVW